LCSDKSSAGRPPNVPYERQKEIFLKYTKCLEDPNIKYNDPIFTFMSQELDHKMSPMALYLSFKRQQSNIFATNYQQSNNVETSPSASCNSPTFSTDLAIMNKNIISKTFSFYLDVYDWKKIQPMIGIKKRTGSSSYRRYRTLPKYKWSCMLKEKIWLNSKLPCTLTFKKGCIRDKYIKLFGKCSQCSAQVVISSEITTEKVFKFECRIDNFDELYEHKKNVKSKLTPYRRRQLAKELQNKPAVLVRNIFASKLITNDNVNSPILPSPAAFRKIKSDGRKEAFPHSDQILSLLIMANDDDNKQIREMCVFPNFRLLFWSDNQIEYYNAYQAKFSKVTLTVDATGSFYETIYLPDRTPLTKRMFLYAGLITGNEKLKSVPSFQMITDSHSQDTILLCLKKWLAFVNSPPQEVIIDDSAALISACVQAFGLYSCTKAYIQHLFSLFERKLSYDDKPKAFIRLDTSHFVKNLYRSFDNKVDLGLKYFYIKCVLFLKKCENYQLLKNTIIDIISVALTQYDGEFCTDIEDETAKSRLNKLIHKIELEDINLGTGNVEQNESHDADALDGDDLEFTVWFDTVVEDVKRQNKNILSNNSNKYYYPPFISTFKRILWKLPLWSNLACSFFESDNKAPSSSGIESHFKTLKHLVFKTKVQKYRVDEFLKSHAEFIDGEIKLAFGDLHHDIMNKCTVDKKKRKRKLALKKTKCQKRTKYTKTSNVSVFKDRSLDQLSPKDHGEINESKPIPKMKVFNEDSIFADQPSFIENWKGQGRLIDKKSVTKLKFIKNGNLCEYVHINSDYVEVKNTCAFDSVMYMFSLGYKQNVYIKNLIDALQEELILQYIKKLSLIDCEDNDIYMLRAKIIQLYLQTPPLRAGDHLIFHCECNATNIFERFPLQSFSSAVFTKQCSNSFCSMPSIKRDILFLCLNLNLIEIFGISCLEEAVEFNEETRECLYCNGKVNFKHDLSEFISFDLNGTNEQFLCDIPRTIIVKGKIYSCIGAIEFSPPLLDGGIGHYKCHSLVTVKNLCYDDNYSRISESSKEKMFLHVISYGLIDAKPQTKQQ
jgi:hypothetical protein